MRIAWNRITRPGYGPSGTRRRPCRPTSTSARPSGSGDDGAAALAGSACPWCLDLVSPTCYNNDYLLVTCYNDYLELIVHACSFTAADRRLPGWGVHRQ